MRLTDADGREGWGEAAATKFYGETAETVLAALERLRGALPEDPFDLEEAERRWERRMRANPAARAALSAALHDLAGKRARRSAAPVLGPGRRAAPQSTFTIGIDTSEKMQAKVREAAQYPDPQGEARHRPGRGDPPAPSAR